MTHFIHIHKAHRAFQLIKDFMKKYILFLIISLVSANCIAMQNLAGKMYDTLNSNSDSESNTIVKIKELLMKDVKINHDFGGGFTPLHYAVLRHKPNVCQFLIEKGACPHIENCDDRTALDLAAGRGHPLYDPQKDDLLMQILKSSSHPVFKPGMNRQGSREKEFALRQYNKHHRLDLHMD